MTEEQKAGILHEINRALERQKNAETYKEKWANFFSGLDHYMRFLIAYARNVGDDLIYNERLKQVEIVNAITGALSYLGFRVVFNDDTTKAIDIVRM